MDQGKNLGPATLKQKYYATEYNVEGSGYWPPIHLHHGICAKSLITEDQSIDLLCLQKTKFWELK